LRLLLLITIVLATTRRDLHWREVPDLDAGRTQPMRALVTNHGYTAHSSGPPAWRKTVVELPEHFKLDWARIEW
jgi:hypothetical protein